MASAAGRHANREGVVPESPVPAGYSGLCITEDEIGYRLRARRLCQRALKYAEHDPITHFLLGNINRNLDNDYASCEYVLAARRSYDTMVRLNPDLQESRNAKNHLEQIAGTLVKLGCKDGDACGAFSREHAESHDCEHVPAIQKASHPGMTSNPPSKLIIIRLTPCACMLAT